MNKPCLNQRKLVQQNLNQKNEAIDMTEQKAKLATKKAAAVKGGRAAAGKPKTTKAGTEEAVKKPVVKKTAAKNAVGVLEKPKRTKLLAVQKAATPAAKKKTPAMNSADTVVKSATIQEAVAKQTPEERYRMVETAAYFIAEQSGFKGHHQDHWAVAEREIAAKLGL